MGTSNGTCQEEFLYFPADGVTKTSLIQNGKVAITLNDEEITLINVRGQVHAIQEKCPHQGGPLHLGEIEDLPNKAPCIKCPWHSWQFNLITGDNVFPGNRPEKKIRIYPVRVEGEKISVGFQQFAKKVFKAIEEKK